MPRFVDYLNWDAESKRRSLEARATKARRDRTAPQHRADNKKLRAIRSVSERLHAQ